MANGEAISAEFPFESRFVEVHGSRMHYIDEGSGEPVLFLHGNPTSSYLWRNIVPHLSSEARCIAPDLIGFGKSDKPDIGYRFFDHARYLEGFIEQLGLRNITLVVHDWGSGLGFHYAMRHEDNIRGIAFMEALLKTESWSEFPKDFRRGFRMFRTPGVGWVMIVPLNAFVKQLLPQTVARGLPDEAKRHYAEPFPTWRSRKPIRVWPNEIPIDGKPADVAAAVSAYSERLIASDLPKLMFTATPGGIIREERAAWAQANLKNLETADIGAGIHFLQEDNPELIGKELARWYATI
ncbi:MAG: haloalkane dehalogenase [Gaiellales bacterium]